MGVCHSDGHKKRDKKDNKTENIKDTEEGKQNEENIKLKSVNNRLSARNFEYNIHLIDSSNNNEFQSTIKGNQILIELLKDTFKINKNADFKIEIENKKEIGFKQKNEVIGDIIYDTFNKDIPEIINMKYSYKGLDIPENSIQSYIDNNKIIGNAIMDNGDNFGIITYDKDTKLISSYKYNINDYPKLNTFNNFTAYCNGKNCLYFSGGETEQSNDLDYK